MTGSEIGTVVVEGGDGVKVAAKDRLRGGRGVVGTVYYWCLEKV